MNKKKILLLLVVLCAAALTLCACGSTGGKSVDERFINSLTKGLEARWVLTDAADSVETAEDWESYFNAEYKQIIAYKDETFENPELEKWAKEYIDSIIKSKEALPYLGTNQWTAKYSNGAYHSRCKALYNINKIVPLSFAEKNYSNITPLLSTGEVVNMVNSFSNSINFKKVESSGSWVTYEAIVENTSSITFSYFSIDVDLIDSSGITIDTTSAYVDNWDPGEKIKFKFSTDEKFSKMELAYYSWNY